MTQLSFSDFEYANKRKTARREVFPERMDELVPWSRLEKGIRRHYPKGFPGHQQPMAGNANVDSIVAHLAAC